jgi:glutaredoxin 3
MVKELFLKSFFDDQHIGGYDETRALEKENKLQELLK